MKWVAVIPGRLPGLNEIVLAARSNRYAGAAQKKKITEQCGQALFTSGFKLKGQLKDFYPVTVHFRWIEPNLRRDPDNITAGMKFILDAMVEGGWIKDDSRQWVKGISHEFPEPDKDNPRVEVEIREVS